MEDLTPTSTIAGVDSNDGPIERAKARAKLGDVAGAARCLSEALDAGAPTSAGERTELLQALIGYLVTASRHGEAFQRSCELASHLGIKRIPRPWVDVLAFFVRAVQRVRPGGVFARALGWCLGVGSLRHGATMEAVRAVQFGQYWHDIRVCPYYALLQLALSRSNRDVIRSIAWLGYSYCYVGRMRGIWFLRNALACAHACNDESTLIETYPALAIAYQMTNQSRRALHYHRSYLRRYRNRSPFYEPLSQTNVLVVLTTLCRFDELKTQMDACFATSFALEASRHHVQIYGVNAVLLAVEGRTAESLKALSLSEHAAESTNNPLDWINHLRLAALTHVLSGEYDKARRCAKQGLARCHEYGSPRWYRQNLLELLAIARAPELQTPYRARLSEATTRYLSKELSRRRQVSDDLKLSQLADQLTEALRTQFEFDPSEPPTVDALLLKLARTFQSDYVVIERDLSALRERVIRDQHVSELGLSSEANGELRFVCGGERFFLGLELVRTSEFREPLAAGLLLGQLDPLAESLVKAAFRLVLAQYVFVHSIRISRDIQAKQQRAAAVGALAQMLAHDVRRPFRMIRTAISTLTQASDPQEFRYQADVVLPEVELATTTAEGLIADVMEFSTGDVAGKRTSVMIETILAAALAETLTGYPGADVRFEYHLEHRTPVEVDAKKVQRVMSNIIANGLQAMGQSGRIVFSTSNVVEQTRPFVAIVIANDGPGIPEADRASLFDPFFTRNKPTGTGLGLAIAHRVVTAHGGTIECMAHKEGAAFRFTLPAESSDASVDRRAFALLPTHTSEMTLGAPQCPWADPPPTTSCNGTQIPVIAIVDDSRAFLMGWRTALAGNAMAYFFTSPEAFWLGIDKAPGLLRRLSAVITDYRFCNSRQTGVAFARALKQRRAELPVFMSSSGNVSQREAQGAIDLELEKGSVAWPTLSKALEIASQRCVVDA